MLYAIRNQDGRIISLSETFQSGADPVSIKDKEVLEFLSIETDDFSAEEFLEKSDSGVSRILEDLIDVLITKNQILFTDLPEQAQKKLLGRKLARNYNNPSEQQAVDSSNNFLDDNETI
jgi:hypothetical protein